MLSQKTKIVVFEGLDGCGKHTQSELLYQHVKNVYPHIPCELISFPKYDNPSIYCVNEFIKDRNLVDVKNNTNYLKVASYLINTCFGLFQKDSKIVDIIENGGILICDRYVTSNYLYQDLKDDKEIASLYNFISDLAYNKFKIPKEDIVFYLNITPQLCMENIIKRGRETDLNENEKYLNKIYKRKDFVSLMRGWKQIDCMYEDKMRPVIEIHYEILSLFTKEIIYEGNDYKHDDTMSRKHEN